MEDGGEDRHGGVGGARAKAALGPVTDCLAKPSFHTQTAAVWALGRIGDKSSVSKLEPFLKTNHELLRFLAEEAQSRWWGRNTVHRKGFTLTRETAATRNGSLEPLTCTYLRL